MAASCNSNRKCIRSCVLALLSLTIFLGSHESVTDLKYVKWLCDQCAAVSFAACLFPIVFTDLSSLLFASLALDHIFYSICYLLPHDGPAKFLTLRLTDMTWDATKQHSLWENNKAATLTSDWSGCGICSRLTEDCILFGGAYGQPPATRITCLCPPLTLCQSSLCHIASNFLPWRVSSRQIFPWLPSLSSLPHHTLHTDLLIRQISGPFNSARKPQDI